MKTSPELTAATSPSTAKVFEFQVIADVPPRPGFRDISDIIREREADHEKAARLERARQRLAARLHAEEVPTLALLRLRKGWSQAKLARVIGTSQSAIAMFEAGRREPYASNVAALATALGVSADTVLEALGVKVTLEEAQ